MFLIKKFINTYINNMYINKIKYSLTIGNIYKIYLPKLGYKLVCKR